MNVSTALRTAGVTLLAGFALTACGGGDAASEPAETTKTAEASEPTQSPTPTPTPSPTPTLREFQADGGYYIDVYDLQEAYVLAGGDCEDGEYWGFVAFGNGTIECDFDTMIDTFDSPEHLQKYKDKMIEMGNIATYDFTTDWLQGKNWLVRSTPEDQAAIQKELGGELVEFSTGPSHR